MAKTSDDTKDLDETRRLCYMALAAPYTEKYNLAGTLTNALCHHQQANLDDTFVMGKVLAAIEGPAEVQPAARTWLREQIARITRELGD